MKTSKQSFPFPNPLDRVFKYLHDMPKLVVDTVPSINITEEKDNYRIDVAVPGLKKEDFNIDIEGNVLTISTTPKKQEEKTDDDFFSRKEYDYSSFDRSFTIPDNTDENNITAKYADGILSLNIPKATKEKKAKTQKVNID